MFVYGSDGQGDTVDHDSLANALKTRELWSDALTPVILPKGVERGEPTWWYAFQFKPPERSPRLSRLVNQIESRAGVDNVVDLGKSIEAYLTR